MHSCRRASSSAPGSQERGPPATANAIVQATTHYDNPKILAEVSKGLGAPMRGIALEAIPEGERLAVRGW